MTRLPAQLPRYQAGLGYAWVLGHFQVMELLRWRPEATLEVRLHGDLEVARRQRLEEACARAGVALRRDDRAVEAKRSKGTARALALYRPWAQPLDGNGDHLLLVRPGDPGNLGAALRSALAFGVRDVALVGDADPFHPHVARASLGALFALRVRAFDRLEAYVAENPQRPLLLFDGRAPLALDAALADLPRPASFGFGPEWPGLRDDERALGRAVRIPHAPEVESLNLPVAVGIALQAATSAPRR